MVTKALVAASSKPLILSILRGGESYGYEIIQRVKELSGGELEWADGMLYPVLHRLEKEEFISSRWKLSEEGRRRKYYRLTQLGREEHQKEMKEWENISRIVKKSFQIEPVPNS
ncbi:MAG: PadR family transcriptional regulator [Rhodothermaceae bacterium]